MLSYDHERLVGRLFLRQLRYYVIFSYSILINVNHLISWASPLWMLPFLKTKSWCKSPIIHVYSPCGVAGGNPYGCPEGDPNIQNCPGMFDVYINWTEHVLDLAGSSLNSHLILISNLVLD